MRTLPGYYCLSNDYKEAIERTTTPLQMTLAALTELERAWGKEALSDCTYKIQIGAFLGAAAAFAIAHDYPEKERHFSSALNRLIHNPGDAINNELTF